MSTSTSSASGSTATVTVEVWIRPWASVTGIDSEALEALTYLKREREEDLGMVKLCHQSDVMKKIFEMTRLNRQFEAFDHLDDALKSFG